MANQIDDDEITQTEVINPQNEEAQENPSIDATDEDLSIKKSYESASAAIALSYDTEQKENPFVSALGYESRAQAIIDMARELGIYVHKDPALLNQMKNLKEGEEVPKELFTIIATILSFSYYLQGKTPETYKRKDGSTAVNTDA
jgi:flagellar biosynthesis protein